MPTETHTGKLNFGDGQVTMDDGTVLAVAGSLTPCATALAQFAKWGETQPVTVTGLPGIVNNAPVLFVSSIQWAAPADSLAAASAVAGATSIPTTPPPVPKPKRKRSASKK